MFIKANLLGIRNEIAILISAFLLSITPIVVFADDAADDAAKDKARVTELEQSADEESTLEEVTVTGSQIKGAAISEALSVSIISAVDIEMLGISSGDELLDYMPENGQNFHNEAENISGGVNSVRGDIGTPNLRNMGTGNTLVLLNGRRLVNSAGYQTEEIGGSFVPVNSVNSNEIPVFGVERVEVLRDGASAIYGADAVAGVLNTVLKKDFEGFTVSFRQDSYDNLPRDDQRINLEYGSFFNGGRTNVGVFASFYQHDRVNSKDDPRWLNNDYRPLLVGTPWEGLTSWRNDSADSSFSQFDLVSSASGSGLSGLDITDGAGEFETYPLGDPRCEGGWQLNSIMCGHEDGQGTYRYNINENRDLSADLERVNVFLYVNHEMENGSEAFTEFSWYESDTNLIRHSAVSTTGVELQVGAQNYYNPFGPCGSPNRLPDSVIGTDVPCSGLALTMDNHRHTEVPRIIDNKATTWRFLQGFRGSKGAWDWEAAVVLSKAERNDVTHNRISNTLMVEALNDPTAAAYNPFNGGGLLPSNIERTLVDVYRSNETELNMIDFKMTNNELFNMPAGPVGFLVGVEYREESFDDDRDGRLDGTIAFTDFQGDTYPFVSDVMNSSPTGDSRGSRDVTSVMVEFALPVFENLDVQLAARYEDFSDVGSTTVGKVAFGWRPVDQLLVRGSWSEAYRAPNLITINEELVVRTNTRNDYTCLFADPNQDVLDCRNGVQRRASGSRTLQPEQSTNTSFGVVWDASENLTFTLDYWSIEKDDTIGLFGEENHSILDLLFRLQAGTGSCGAGVGNPAVGRLDVDPDEVDIYLAAGICPAGQIEFIDDTYQNLDTRTIEGHDVGIYYDIDTGIGDFRFKYVGTFYDKYEQIAGGAASVILNAINDGTLPANTPLDGFADLIRRDGNQDEKHNASVRWSKDAFAASVTMFKLGDFYQSSQTLADGTQWIVDSMTTYNMTVDYKFDMFEANSRIRLGINNFTDERAPLADRNFGFFADAHRDYGRYYYLDLRMTF
jgi:iron complex outermembrane receptor protein